MTAQRIITEQFLEDDYEFEGHPADLEQVIEAAFEKYQELPKSNPIRKKFRERLNEMVDRLTEMRQFKQFTYAS